MIVGVIISEKNKKKIEDQEADRNDEGRQTKKKTKVSERRCERRVVVMRGLKTRRKEEGEKMGRSRALQRAIGAEGRRLRRPTRGDKRALMANRNWVIKASRQERQADLEGCVQKWINS